MNHKIVRHPVTNAVINAIPIVVPNKWEMNNVLFPRKSRWMFDKHFDAKKYYYLIDEFFHLDSKIGEHYDSYLATISEHYANIFKGTCVRLMLKGLVLFMDRPQQFANDYNIVLISLMNDLKVALYRRIFCDSKYGSHDKDLTLVLMDSANKLIPMRLIPFGKLLKLSERLYETLYLPAIKILPKFQHNSKQ